MSTVLNRIPRQPEDQSLTPIRTAATFQSCPVCFGQSRREAEFDDIRLLRCITCRHCYTDVSFLSRGEQYGPEYFEKVHRNWFEHPDVRLFEQVRQLIVGRSRNAAVLDIGCGNGNLLKYLRQKDLQLTLMGIDLCPAQCENGISFVSGDFLTWPFTSKFDVVLSLQVIEHLPAPDLFIKRMCQLSRPNGVVIINTINEQSLLYDVARVARKLGSDLAFKRLFDRHHVNHYNISSLRTLVSRNDLKTVEHLQHNAPMAAMDIPAPDKLTELILRAGVWGVFTIGSLIGRSAYQTIVCRR
jgi:SAM-dependent methyltransferase